MSINIEKIINSSYLNVEEDKKDKFKKDIENIIKMIDEIPNISDKLIINTSHSMDLRIDKEDCSLNREEVLMSSSSTKAGCFVVPKTVD